MTATPSTSTVPGAAVTPAKKSPATPGLPTPDEDSRRTPMLDPREELAHRADQLTRAAHKIVHLVRPERRGETLAHPCDVYTVVAELRETVAHLDQVVKHLVMHSLDVAADARLRHDVHGHGPKATNDARAAAGELERAHRSLGTVYGALDLAQGDYGPLSFASPVGEVR